MDMNRKKSLPEAVARTASIIFHPLFMPLFGLLVIFTAPTLFWYIPLKAKEILFFIYIVNNVLIPISLMPFFRYRNLVSSWYIENRSERTLPLFAVSLLYAITSFILYRLQIPVFFKAYAFSLTMLSLSLLFVNRRWKISLHSAGAGTLIAVILVLSIRMSVSLPFYLAGSVLIGGLILSSRLRLDKHNSYEVYAGFFAGLVIPVVMMLIFQ